MDYKQLESSKLNTLPILKHFSPGEIKLNPQEWRKGEFGLFSVLTILGLVFGGYMLWVYVLPVLGYILQMVTAGAVVLLLLLARQPIYKFFKSIARIMHKSVIRHNPFGELENQEQLMKASEKKFVESRAKISNLRDQMKTESVIQQKEALRLQEDIESYNAKAKKLQERKVSITDQDSDEYVEIVNEIDTLVSSSERAMHLYQQAKDFTTKYADRGAIMSKLDRKLSRIATKIKIKILDFQATIEILKRDFNFAENSRVATEAAKNAMLFDKSWELDYAMEVITSTIASDLAATASNLSDIDMMTGSLMNQMDDDAMFAKLDKLATSIKTGEDSVPDTKKYNNPEYKRTSADKAVNPGFEEIF
jgi:hypothetical protein